MVPFLMLFEVTRSAALAEPPIATHSAATATSIAGEGRRRSTVVRSLRFRNLRTGSTHPTPDPPGEGTNLTAVLPRQSYGQSGQDGGGGARPHRRSTARSCDASAVVVRRRVRDRDPGPTV